MTGNPGLGMHSDRDLVLAFQAGDRSAYEELYRRHHDRVARVCYRFLNNSPDAEEAAQETFLKAFQALPRFNGQYQVGAWLARIAANVCVDHLRVKSRSHLVALPNEDKVPVLELGPEQILVGDHPRIDVAIQEMQPLHASALHMRGVDGLSHVEIAGRLNMTPAQVKALLHRARSSFKRAWDKAQGWLLAPLVKARSLDRSSQVSNASSNIAIVSAQAPALAEKAAASVLIVMVALSGPLSASGPASSGVSMSVPDGTEAERSAFRDAMTPEIDPAGASVKETETTGDADVAALVATLPSTLTSNIQGPQNEPSDADGNDPGPGEDDTIGPTVRETPRKAREVVEDLLDDVQNLPD